MEKEKYNCHHCESVMVEDEIVYTTHYGENVCQSCFDDWYVNCSDCEDINHRDDVIYTVDSRAICDNCRQDYYTCTECDEIYYENDISYVASVGMYYCDDCYSGRFSYCDDCDYEYSDDEYSSCPECSGSPRLFSYDHKPTPIFYGDNANKLFFGMELEVAIPSSNYSKGDLVEKAYELFGDMIYCKRDGSVSSGFEIVTHPISYNQFNILFDANKLKELAKMGGRSWDSETESCGIHIHFSKAAFSKLHLYTFSKLILENPVFFSKFAGRSSHFAEFIYAESSSESLPVAYAKGKKNSRRYLALNNWNEHTIEFRIFKGSLNPQRVRRIIELCSALYDYTKLMTVKNIVDKKMDLQGFIDYVRKNDLMYPELNTHDQFIKEEITREMEIN